MGAILRIYVPRGKCLQADCCRSSGYVLILWRDVNHLNRRDDWPLLVGEVAVNPANELQPVLRDIVKNGPQGTSMNRKFPFFIAGEDEPEHRRRELRPHAKVLVLQRLHRLHTIV
jgi:hypothetical protein